MDFPVPLLSEGKESGNEVGATQLLEEKEYYQQVWLFSNGSPLVIICYDNSYQALFGKVKSSKRKGGKNFN